ncbi:hypothetical protein DBR32_12350 [Taibaiella sp. KBW10]|uniref:HutD/Ves family protein n=1 Tax=Taibaiella sp. KBW10 TaxID=2153357 RepID=UPI000F5B3B1F|nr:HutD family protein [Taibaiella sp. KBW10]RQO30355.1 hypothetical protein DBR32_12350 [Taibaiella sp. KBW10]
MNSQKMHVLKAEQYQTADWTGGQTSQIFIFPEVASYANRDFIFRISAARVMVSPSDFTLLAGYNRIIMSTEDPIVLQQDGNSFTLAPFIPFSFAGAIPTHCIGTTSDFNVMMREGYKASLEVIYIRNSYQAEIAPHTITLFYVAAAEEALFCQEQHLSQKDSLVCGSMATAEHKAIPFTTAATATLLKVTLYPEEY